MLVRNGRMTREGARPRAPRRVCNFPCKKRSIGKMRWAPVTTDREDAIPPGAGPETINIIVCYLRVSCFENRSAYICVNLRFVLIFCLRVHSRFLLHGASHAGVEIALQQQKN